MRMISCMSKTYIRMSACACMNLWNHDDLYMYVQEQICIMKIS